MSHSDSTDLTQSDKLEVVSNPSRRRMLQMSAATSMLGALPFANAQTSNIKQTPAPTSLNAKLKTHIKNVVVIYLENRSFNNLFANFPGESKPLSALTPVSYKQVDRNGTPLPELPKIWGGLIPQAQTIGGKTYQIDENKISGLPNQPYALTDGDGNPLPEGLITRDL